MKNPIFLTFLFILILCVSQVSATTVQNSKYLNTLSVGDSDIFEMKLTADTKNEIGLPLTISKEGDCEFIKVDKEKILISDIPETITANIHVPANSVNGLHKCEIMFTAPSNGMAQSRIGVPFLITVVGGLDATTTTTATPTIQTTTPTTEPTTALTMKAPRPDPTDPPQTLPNVRDFKSPSFDLVMLAICVSLAAMWIYEHFQNKKGEKK